MNSKGRIRIIKRDDRNRQETGETQASPRQSAPEAARDMVANVSNWVSELQNKRRMEASQALKGLFPERPEPSGA
jgi:formylglycine-generating enzyme required for sulfatase activity